MPEEEVLPEEEAILPEEKEKKKDDIDKISDFGVLQIEFNKANTEFTIAQKIIEVIISRKRVELYGIHSGGRDIDGTEDNIKVKLEKIKGLSIAPDIDKYMADTKTIQLNWKELSDIAKECMERQQRINKRFFELLETEKERVEKEEIKEPEISDDEKKEVEDKIKEIEKEEDPRKMRLFKGMLMNPKVSPFKHNLQQMKYVRYLHQKTAKKKK